MSGRVLMLQGTASSVGKSLMTSALCRIYAQRGFSVAPFKAQNMALNSFVTPAGHEIGRAQAVQAQAARCTPSVQMNPILLKPEAGNNCQVVIMGTSAGRMSAVDYHEHKPQLGKIISDSLAALRSAHDLVIIEGAGSPVEVNLKTRDIVNMFVAKLADAPVLIVGDIDRGGIFASLVGTMELLEPDERARVAGFIINKFRGDPALLGNGLDFLHERTGVPVLGVVPHLPEICLADEDSTSLEGREALFDATDDGNRIDIAVIRWPHISNYDDVLPLEREPSVRLRFVTSADAIEQADLVLLPGSKCTVADLDWFRGTTLLPALRRRAEVGGAILGICGGCQMLGQHIDDPDGVESKTPKSPGLGLLPITTRYHTTKTTAQVVARTSAASYLSQDDVVVGYEIHMGEVSRVADATPLFSVETRNGEEQANCHDGAVSKCGAVVGTMIHGLFDNDGVRSALLRHLKPECSGSSQSFRQLQEAEFDRLAEHVRSNLSMNELDAIIGVTGCKR